MTERPPKPMVGCVCRKGRWNPACPQHPPSLCAWAFPRRGSA